MSILTDFFIANADELDSLHVELLLRDQVPTLEMNNVDSSKIELLADLMVENAQGKMLVLARSAVRQKFVSVDGWSEEDFMDLEQWIERFDPVFVERLAIFPAEQMSRVATQWATRWEEFDGQPAGTYSAESLVELMRQLCDLARQAYTEKKQMYLRTCL